MVRETKLIGCYPEGGKLEVEILKEKEKVVLTGDQSVEVDCVAPVDMYVELLATRRVLERLVSQNEREDSPKRPKREPVQEYKVLKVVEEVHSELRSSLLECCKPGCNATISSIAQSSANLIQRMRDDIFCKVIKNME